MCYDIDTATARIASIARRRGIAEDDVQKDLDFLHEAWNKLRKGERYYHTSAFDHALLTVVYRRNPLVAEEMRWGLLPSWVKDNDTALRLQNRTVNARSETMFEKPAFRKAAVEGRGVLPVAGFFEYHHKGSKTFPHYIYKKDNSVMLLAVLWDTHTDSISGQPAKTFAIVTTAANNMMARIHNNPKLKDGARMPLILAEDDAIKWMCKDLSQEQVMQLAVPFDENLLSSHTVRPLRGKNHSPNGPQSVEVFVYPEMAEQGRLF